MYTKATRISRGLFAGCVCLCCLCGRQSSVQYRTIALEKGDIRVEVTASGTINPHFLVQVGTQVSGTISRILVDFNSPVKKGQLIALIDTTFLYAAVQDAAATRAKAQAQETLTQTTERRTKELFDKGLAAQADLDQATADYASAKAALSSAQAGLDRAKINLAYARIVSPITGVVVNRAVDVGQTVAASFNTPTLFTIADDLSKMQVQASIDEADIGQIKKGQDADFTVDAYPNKKFSGKVTQIRLNPTTVQNVVSYTVMIDVDNPDLQLLPGMTANITVNVEQVHDVFKVPGAALKFIPQSVQGTWGKHPKSADARDTSSGRHRGSGAAADSTKRRGGFGGDSAGARINRGKIFILDNEKPLFVPVKTGLSSGGFTEIEGNLHEGQLVIVGLLNQSSAKPSAQTTPLGMQPPGGPGGGMGRMR